MSVLIQWLQIRGRTYCLDLNPSANELLFRGKPLDVLASNQVPQPEPITLRPVDTNPYQNTLTILGPPSSEMCIFYKKRFAFHVAVGTAQHPEPLGMMWLDDNPMPVVFLSKIDSIRFGQNEHGGAYQWTPSVGTYLRWKRRHENEEKLLRLINFDGETCLQIPELVTLQYLTHEFNPAA